MLVIRLGIKMNYRIILFAALVFTPTNAFAWDVSVDGPDVFDKIKVIATKIGLNANLVIQCDSESDLLLAYVFKKKEFDKTVDAPAKLFVKTGDGPPTVLEASFRDWNDNYSGVVVSGRTDELQKVLADIGSAKKKIQAGIDVLGIKDSAGFGTLKSTQVVNTIFEKCKLTKPKS